MRSFQQPGRSPVYAPNAVVSTSHPLASQVGIDILKSGGNAVDAAIAACATLCVVEPAMTGIGGDCFALINLAGSSEVIAMNGSGKAPAAATVENLKSKGVQKLERNSPHTVTVPGAIAAWSLLNETYGKKSLGDLLAPAINYAENGYPIAPKVGFDWMNGQNGLSKDEVASKIMLVDGKAPKVGSVHRQVELAGTMKKIAQGGRDAFYTGEVAQDMVDRLNSLGGVHTMEDFAAANAEFVTPISTNYKGYDIYECPPNGQGICALMILNILSGYDWSALNEADRVHLLAEATKIAYHERDRFISDPKHVDIDIEGLLSAKFADGLRAMIDMNRAQKFQPSDFPKHRDTIYLSVVDAEGNAVSFINSIFDGFGSTIMAPKSGVMFHNRGASFNLNPDHVNCIAPGKRPMHTIIPGMVMKDGQAVAPFGVMGGQYQSTGHATFLSNVIDLGMDPQEAMDAPRSFAVDGRLQVEETFHPSTYTDLMLRGHDLSRENKPVGGGQVVWIDRENGVLIGGSDPRKDGCSIGY